MRARPPQRFQPTPAHAGHPGAALGIGWSCRPLENSRSKHLAAPGSIFPPVGLRARFHTWAFLTLQNFLSSPEVCSGALPANSASFDGISSYLNVTSPKVHLQEPM